MRNISVYLYMIPFSPNLACPVPYANIRPQCGSVPTPIQVAEDQIQIPLHTHTYI